MIRSLMLFFAILVTGTVQAQELSVGDTVDDPMQLAITALAGFPEEEAGNPGLSVDVSFDFWGNMTVLIAETGFADDSVNGARDQYVFEPMEGGGWTLTFQETQYLCRRGANTVTWQTGFCP